MRESLKPDAAHASVFVTPRFGRNIEAPDYYVRLMTRLKAGAETTAIDSRQLNAPYTSNDRLLGYCWLRLKRKGDVFSASVSTNGQSWTPVGETKVALKKNLLVGLGVCSCLNTATTYVKFDNVTVSEESSTSRVVSPDGNVGIDFVLTDEGRPAYKIDYESKPIVLESQLGFEPDFAKGFELIGSSTQTHEGQWTNDFGERKVVPDNYHELNIDLKHTSGKLMRLTFRALTREASNVSSRGVFSTWVNRRSTRTPPPLMVTRPPTSPVRLKTKRHRRPSMSNTTPETSSSAMVVTSIIFGVLRSPTWMTCRKQSRLDAFGGRTSSR